MKHHKIRNIIIIFYTIFILLCMSPQQLFIQNVSAAYEDFTPGGDYSENDPASNIEISDAGDQINITLLHNDRDNAYVVKDLLTEQQLNATDWSVSFEFWISSQNANAERFRGSFCSFGNELDDMYDCQIVQFCGYIINPTNYTPRAIIGHHNGATRNQKGAQDEGDSYIDDETWYYAYFNRTGSTIEYRVYSDASRTNQECKLSYTGVSTTDFRYFYPIQSHVATSYGSQEDTYKVKNYTLTVDGCLQPDAPTNGNVTYTPATTTINLTWTKGTNANNTVIVYRTDRYPTSRTDGTVWYNGTNTWYENNAININQYYYIRGWSESYWTNPGGYKLSTDNLTFEYGNLIINTFDENTSNPIALWHVNISNAEKSSTYENTAATNPLIISIADLPFGNDSSIVIGADTGGINYTTRIYYLDLSANAEYSFYAYLTEQNGTESYVLRVLDQISNPVENAKVQILRYINSSTGWDNISILLTDPNGYCTVDLVPGVQYAARVSKTGYVTKISDLFPIPIEWGDERYHTLRINEEKTQYLHPLENITYEMQPDTKVHDTAITFFFNLTSSQNELSYFYMQIYKFNTTTYVWDLLNTASSTTSSGGSLSYTTSNTTGLYGQKCWFKKTGSPKYTFGGELEYMYLYTIFHNASFTPIISDPDNINTLIENGLGQSPVYIDTVTVVAYTSLITVGVVTYILFTFAPNLAGFGVMILALVLAAFKDPLGLITETEINTTSVVLIFILGVLSLIILRKKG